MKLYTDVISSIERHQNKDVLIDLSSREILNYPEFELSFRKIILLCELIKSSEIIRIKYTSGKSFSKSILPILLLGRFFQKKMILEYRNSDRFDVLDSPNWLLKKILKQFHMILIDSETLVRKLIKKGINTAQLVYKTNISDFKIRSKIQPTILLDLSVNDNFNLHCVLEAYRLVKQKYPRTEIVISSPDKRKLEHEYSIDISDYPGISMSSEDIGQLIDRADIYLNCRFYEFLPATIIDALSSGLPVISTPVGMINKLINRDNILLYNFNDHVTLSDLIIELIENQTLTEKLSNNGHILSNNFNEVKIRTYNQFLYNQLLNDN